MLRIGLSLSLVVPCLGATLSCTTVVVRESRPLHVRVDTPQQAYYLGEDVLSWSTLLVSRDRKTRETAARTLVDGGAAALPVLGSLLRMPFEPVQLAAREVVQSIGRPAVPMLCGLTTNVQPRTRFHAVNALHALAPEARDGIPFLARALLDPYPAVAMDAARALAAMGADAAGAVGLLERALLHEVREVRTASAGALAAIGPSAASAWRSLSIALGDSHPSVRRSAAVALGAIGKNSAPAVPRLLARLDVPNVHVRVSIVEALGSIGVEATDALDALHAVSKDPALKSQVAWAVARIEGRETPARSSAATSRPIRLEPHTAAHATAESWRMFCGGTDRNAVVRDAKIPHEWDTRSGENIRWSAPLGSETYGTPMVSSGRVYIGTDNAHPRVAGVRDEQGILYALRESDGQLLWQDAAPSLGRGIDNFLLPTTTSSPLLADSRLYYLTAQGVLRCLEQSDDDATLVWKLDLGAELGVFPHEAPNCAALPFGDALLLCTSNGVDETHANIPAPRAPSFIAVHRRTGRVLWSVVGPSPRVLHGQWSSPALIEVRGRELALFGGGDGQLYALDAASGKEIWRFDGNPVNAVWRRGSDVDGRAGRNSIIACPVVHDGRVHVTAGTFPMMGVYIYALDAATGQVLWVNDNSHDRFLSELSPRPDCFASIAPRGGTGCPR